MTRKKRLNIRNQRRIIEQIERVDSRALDYNEFSIRAKENLIGFYPILVSHRNIREKDRIYLVDLTDSIKRKKTVVREILRRYAKPIEEPPKKQIKRNYIVFAFRYNIVNVGRKTKYSLEYISERLARLITSDLFSYEIPEKVDVVRHLQYITHKYVLDLVIVDVKELDERFRSLTYRVARKQIAPMKVNEYYEELEGLDRLILENYVAKYRAFPCSRNLLAYNLTPYAYRLAKGKSGTLYVLRGLPIDKDRGFRSAYLPRSTVDTYSASILSRKPTRDVWNALFKIGYVEKLDDYTQVPTAKGTLNMDYGTMPLSVAVFLPHKIRDAVSKALGQYESRGAVRLCSIYYTPRIKRRTPHLEAKVSPYHKNIKWIGL